MRESLPLPGEILSEVVMVSALAVATQLLRATVGGS